MRKTYAVPMVFILLALVGILRSQSANPLANPGPLTPAEELKSFQIASGFTVELAASEPMVIDPVAMAEDESGRLYVAEMIGYPNGGIGTGDISSGRIKLLVDTDRDGKYDKFTIFATGLRFPLGIMPWKKGILVANAPDLVYLEDTDGDGKSDKSSVLYTGFNTYNIQQMLNTFRWGLDNQIHSVNGSNGGTIISKEGVQMTPVELRGRGIRFRPDQPGKLDPATGGGQYGLTMDSYGHWFSSTNSNHIRQMVLPDAELRRNPNLAVGSMVLDIAEHGSSCKVFRISPFEAWRVERTNRRKVGADAKRLPSTELVPGGFSTSSCSPLLLDSTSFPEAYRNSVIICEPANNAILRDIVEPKGLAFVARRGDPEKEFLASTDNWFRPVCLQLALDGSVLLLDFYREVIETPLSLPEDMKATLPLKTQAKGRIWRIKPEGFQPMKPFPARDQGPLLVQELESGNQSRRMLAQQLLVEGDQISQKDSLVKMAHNKQSPLGRLHALCTLDGLGLLGESDLLPALSDRTDGLREHAVRLSRPFLEKSPRIKAMVYSMVDDPSVFVRCQVAFALGEVMSNDAISPLKKLAMKDGSDRWMQTAILSSCYKHGAALLVDFLKDSDVASGKDASLSAFLARLAASSSQNADRKTSLELISTVLGSKLPAGTKNALVEGVLSSLVGRSGGASTLWSQVAGEEKEILDKLRPMFKAFKDLAMNEKSTPASRQAAVKMLSSGPPEVMLDLAKELLVPATPPTLQSAILQALNQGPASEVGGIILEKWEGFSPGLRREAVETLFSNKARFPLILAALEKGTIRQGQLEAERIARLKSGLDDSMKARLEKMVKMEVNISRAKVIEAYKHILSNEGNASAGKEVFRKQCATCHKLEGVGYQVGPELIAAIRGKGKEYLLTSILDPSKEVDSRYVNYTVETKQGRVLSGILVAESGTSVTLRRGENAEDTLLRNQIESIQSANKSLMPEGLEAQINQKDMSDLLEYLVKIANN